MDKRRLSERDTCAKLIIPTLRKAGRDKILQVPKEVSFAIPPFNTSNWGGERLRNEPRPGSLST